MNGGFFFEITSCNINIVLQYGILKNTDTNN